MGHAVIFIDVTQWHRPPTIGINDFDRPFKDQNGGGNVATEGGKTGFSRRRDVTDITIVFQAILIGAAPSFALVIKYTAGIETEIAAKCRDLTVRCCGNLTGRISDSRVALSDAAIS